ncbi:hypothetical protein J1605_021586 [Eschrichtius robustus]|uniref:Uncharacterized protein n=1 Tax=Eschrichtius robustus TaxID=9764 RepID=A0AB34HCF4_ESCRO|nr:hypothetical protein J1605_021586 [Eschrichtius robustus]
MSCGGLRGLSPGIQEKVIISDEWPAEDLQHPREMKVEGNDEGEKGLAKMVILRVVFTETVLHSLTFAKVRFLSPES